MGKGTGSWSEPSQSLSPEPNRPVATGPDNRIAQLRRTIESMHQGYGLDTNVMILGRQLFGLEYNRDQESLQKYAARQTKVQLQYLKQLDVAGYGTNTCPDNQSYVTAANRLPYLSPDQVPTTTTDLSQTACYSSALLSSRSVGPENFGLSDVYAHMPIPIHLYLNSLKRIGASSVYGIVIEPGYGNNSPDQSAPPKPITLPFVIKTATKARDPTLVHEAFVGIYGLNLLRARCSNFVYTLSATACAPAAVAEDRDVVSMCDVSGVTQYIMLENLARTALDGTSLSSTLATTLVERLTWGEYFSVLLQIAFALNYAQQSLGFVHYDLHGSNILTIGQDKQRGNFWAPTVGLQGETVYILTRDLPVIIDFGLSRLELDGQAMGLGANDRYGVNIPSSGIRSDRQPPLFDIYKVIISSAGRVVSGLRRNRNDPRLQSIYKGLSKVYRFFGGVESLKTALNVIGQEDLHADLYYASDHPDQPNMTDFITFLTQRFSTLSGKILTRDYSKVQSSRIPVFTMPRYTPSPSSLPAVQSYNLTSAATYTDFVYGVKVMISGEPRPELAAASTSVKSETVVSRIDSKEVNQYIDSLMRIYRSLNIPIETGRLRTRWRVGEGSWDDVADLLDRQEADLANLFSERNIISTTSNQVKLSDLKRWLRIARSDLALMAPLVEYISSLVSTYVSSVLLRVFTYYVSELPAYLAINTNVAARVKTSWSSADATGLQQLITFMSEIDGNRQGVNEDILQPIGNYIDQTRQNLEDALRRVRSTEEDLRRLDYIAPVATTISVTSPSYTDELVRLTRLPEDRVRSLLSKYDTSVTNGIKTAQGVAAETKKILKTIAQQMENFDSLLFGTVEMFSVPLTVTPTPSTTTVVPMDGAIPTVETSVVPPTPFFQ